jgi:hypothetical protein
VKNLGIALYSAALKVEVHYHNCLEIPVLWCIGVERDEGRDLEAVVGGYSCDCDPLGEESRVRGLEMAVRRCPLLKGLRKGEKK